MGKKKKIIDWFDQLKDKVDELGCEEILVDEDDEDVE